MDLPSGSAVPVAGCCVPLPLQYFGCVWCCASCMLPKHGGLRACTHMFSCLLFVCCLLCLSMSDFAADCSVLEAGSTSIDQRCVPSISALPPDVAYLLSYKHNAMRAM